MSAAASVSERSTIRIAWLEARCEFFNVLRTPAFAIPSLVFPAMFYAFFGLAFQSGGEAQAVYMLATLGAFGVMGPAMFGFGVGVAEEREKGWLVLRRAAPASAAGYFFGKIAMSMVFAALIVMMLFALAGLVGGVALPPVQWSSLAGVLLTGVVPFSALGLVVGSWAGGQAAVAIVNLIYLPMAFLSGLWVPISMFPEWLQGVSVTLPAFHFGQLALKTVGMDEGYAAGLHVLVLLGFGVLCLLPALVGFRRHRTF